MSKPDLSKEFCQLPKFVREELLTAQSVGQQFGWQIENFDLPEAWKDTCGEGVTVAVLDTGCDMTHPDLIENLLPGYNVTNPKLPPNDDNGHGCVAPDCLIHTSAGGVERIEDFYNRTTESPERQVETRDGKYTVKTVSAKTFSLDVASKKMVIGNITSVQKLPVHGSVVEIVLEGNIRYELTPWHPVYLRKSGHHKTYTVVRKRADEIVPGDQFIYGNGTCEFTDSAAKVELPPRLACADCGHKPKWKKTPSGQCKKCNRRRWEWSSESVEVSDDLAYLCGITLTDGHVCKDRFEVTSITPEILDRVENIASRHGWATGRENQRVLVYGRIAVETVVAMGVAKGKKSLTQDLPVWVGSCPRMTAYMFLAGVVDGDGSISKNNSKNRITTGSRVFAHKTAALMNALGIRSSVSGPHFDKRNRAIRSNAPVFKIVHACLPPEMIEGLCHPLKLKRSKLAPKFQRKSRRVKSVTQKEFNGFFYDFTVDVYNNYIADGHFVSNTHVSGIIAASNNDLGIVGVANCCKILPIKVLNRVGAGRMDHVVEGIKVAIDKGADLICMSLGTRNPLDEVYNVIKKAADTGVTCFVAAGNAGQTGQLLYPAAYDITVSIGAVDENSMRAAFSCTGPNLDFVAPGVGIYSTVPASSYAMMTGTSQAAPFAIGVAALILAHRRKTSPSLKMNKVDYVTAMKTNALTVQNLDEKYAQLGNRFFQGFGIINPDHFTEWLDGKKVEGVAQTLSNALSDLGMIKETTDVSALRKLNTALTKQLKEFPKLVPASAQKRKAQKSSSASKRRG